ncbi:MAG: anaerobic glycerol-3-phosphate dehydrogenase subunit C [Acidimicrobiia bacterium]|nr:anaerobic glycerol-3-phosphate dehydrogenase subunit C [Acidimicrobiia bacterium]
MTQHPVAFTIVPAPTGRHLPVEATLDNCIKCNICVTVCPVAAVTDRFPGPKYEGPQAGRFRGGNQPAPDASVDYCSGCRMCNMACPTGVKIAEINARARARLVEQGEVGKRHRVRNNLLARPATLSRVGAPVGPMVNALFANRVARWAAEKMLGIHRRAPLPRYAGERFSRWLRRWSPTGERRAGKVAYFTGCSAEHYEPRVARMAVQVLDRLGIEVVVPDQGCCGLPLLSNGEFHAARAYHQANVDRLVGFARDGIPIVGASTSCTLTLKEEAPELLDAMDEEDRLVAAATFDIHEFLVLLAEDGRFPDDLRPVPLRLLYHPPCQYRAHRLGLPALDMMELVPGLEVVASEAACCGVAGTYGYKEEKYDIAMAVGQPLFDRVAAVGGPVAVCDAETCRWQIEHGTGVPAIHPIEIIAYALGLDAEGPLAEAIAGAAHGDLPPSDS